MASYPIVSFTSKGIRFVQANNKYIVRLVLSPMWSPYSYWRSNLHNYPIWDLPIVSLTQSESTSPIIKTARSTWSSQVSTPLQTGGFVTSDQLQRSTGSNTELQNSATMTALVLPIISEPSIWGWDRQIVRSKSSDTIPPIFQTNRHPKCEKRPPNRI